MYFSLFPSKICVTVLCQHLGPNRCVDWSQRAVTAGKETARLHQTPRTTGRLLQTSGYCIPVSMSSRHCQGQGSLAQVWTPGWPGDFHPTELRSSGRCTRSRSSHSTCRGSQLSAAPTPGQRAWAVHRDTSVSPVLHSDSRLSVQLCSCEPFSHQINDLSLQTQPTTQFIRSLTLIRHLVSGSFHLIGCLNAMLAVSVARPPAANAGAFQGNKHSLKRSGKVFGDFAVAEVVATVSRQLLHLPLASSILSQLPKLQLFCEDGAQ